MMEAQEERNPPKAAKFSEALTAPNSFFLFCLLSLFLAGAYYFFGWPISGGSDTDLWYHLNGGRYLFAHGKVPDSGFFSFIAKERHWANYYWFFQATAYSLFSFFGYHGLIILRTVLYILTLGSIALFLRKDFRREGESLYFTIITVVLFLALLPRYFAVVRPHMFSYLFIVLFICIFESRKKYLLYWLPLLAIFWANVHGVEYPVMMLICFAYLAEIFVERLKTRLPVSKDTLHIIIPVLITLYAVFVTPFGADLLFSPFEAAPYQHLYIGEMSKPDIASFFNFNFTTVTASFTALSNLLILIALISCAIGLFTRKVKISHLLLLAGGIYLLLKANRFRYEIVLLSLPLIKFHPLFSLEEKNRKNGGLVRLCAGLLILSISIGFLHSVFRPRGNYPLTLSNVPAGIAAFLKHVRTGGKILNDPNHGGYLQWELGEAYPIFMDMEMMLFTDEDIYMAANAFINSQVLDKVIARHDPSFIVPLITNEKFKKIIKGFPDYSPVFFDDVAVLYVDTKQHPEIAAQYGLKTIEPYGLAPIDIGSLPDAAAAMMLEEIQRVGDIYPDGELVNQLQVQFARRQKDYDRALRHADLLTGNFPDRPAGFQLQGDVFFVKQQFDKAQISYEKALQLSEGADRPGLYKKISACFSKRGRPVEAYQSFKKAVAVYATGTEATDYYELGRLALAAGQRKDGAMYLRFALYKTPGDNIEMVARIKAQLLMAALQGQQKN